MRRQRHKWGVWGSHLGTRSMFMQCRDVMFALIVNEVVQSSPVQRRMTETQNSFLTPLAGIPFNSRAMEITIRGVMTLPPQSHGVGPSEWWPRTP